MIKTFLILLNFQLLLFSSQQIILVVSDDFNTSKASLECFEDDKRICNTQVNIGTNGLGWGLGEIKLHQKNLEPYKQEGDKKAPAGIFKLGAVFGYEEKQNLQLPYLYASKNLICVDDGDSEFYNQIIDAPHEKPKSFEYMKREDAQYELGIVVEHNKQALKNRGSCIFMHVYKAKDASTAGCTAMSLEDMQKISVWLDEKKNPLLIQIPKSSSEEILRLYPALKSSTLLQTK